MDEKADWLEAERNWLFLLEQLHVPTSVQKDVDALRDDVHGEG